MQRERELRKPRAQCIEKPICIGLVLEPHDQIIGITN
jgi:hypothetical protein